MHAIYLVLKYHSKPFDLIQHPSREIVWNVHVWVNIHLRFLLLLILIGLIFSVLLHFYQQYLHDPVPFKSVAYQIKVVILNYIFLSKISQPPPLPLINNKYQHTYSFQKTLSLTLPPLRIVRPLRGDQLHGGLLIVIFRCVRVRNHRQASVRFGRAQVGLLVVREGALLGFLWQFCVVLLAAILGVATFSLYAPVAIRKRNWLN